MARWARRFYSLIFAPLLLISLGSCGIDNSTRNRGDASPCPPSTAQLLVGDAFLKAVCGCQEGVRTSNATDNTRLNCTVPLGTMVYFSFSGSLRSHQIISTGTNTFTSSPVFSRELKAGAISTYAIVFSVSGTYDFQDNYSPGILGRIIVP